MTNPLLRAVQEYIDNESAYVRDVEGEIQVLHRQLNHARVRALRSAIAALYWRAGHAFEMAPGYEAMGSFLAAQMMQSEAFALASAARAMEAAL